MRGKTTIVTARALRVHVSAVSTPLRTSKNSVGWYGAIVLGIGGEAGRG